MGNHDIDVLINIPDDGWKIICDCGWESWENLAMADAHRMHENHRDRIEDECLNG